MFMVEKCKHSQCLEKKLNLYKRKLERECVTFLCLQKQGNCLNWKETKLQFILFK